MKEAFRYVFSPEVPAGDLEDTLLLSVLAAECLHGQTRVKLDASYSISPTGREIVIDVKTPVGWDIVRVFTGFAIREFGERSFTVKRIDLDQAGGGA